MFIDEFHMKELRSAIRQAVDENLNKDCPEFKTCNRGTVLLGKELPTCNGCAMDSARRDAK